jgi:hypothetical protein
VLGEGIEGVPAVASAEELAAASAEDGATLDVDPDAPTAEEVAEAALEDLEEVMEEGGGDVVA